MVTFLKPYLLSGLVIIIAAILGMFFVFQTHKSQRGDIAVLQYISVPSGWYRHQLDNGDVLFTRSPTLPNIAKTEALVYGEQIQVSRAPVNEPLSSWAMRYVGDNVLAPSKKWGMINGHQTLQAEVSTEGDEGLDFVVFQGDLAYIFFLYPSTIYSSSTKQFAPNATDIGTLENMVDVFANHI